MGLLRPSAKASSIRCKLSVLLGGRGGVAYVARGLPYMPQHSCCLNNAPIKHMRDDYVAACICQFFPFIPDTNKHEGSNQKYNSLHNTTISRSQRSWAVNSENCDRSCYLLANRCSRAYNQINLAM